MRICSITPRYTPQVGKSFGSNPSKSDEFDSSQVMPPYLPQRSVDLLRNFYNELDKDQSWLRDQAVISNGIRFSLIDGPYNFLPKAIKAVYPNGTEVAACKYHDAKNGEVIRYSIRENQNSPYKQGFLTDLPGNILVCNEPHCGSYLSPSLSEDSVKEADKYLSKFYSDAIEAYNQ